MADWKNPEKPGASGYYDSDYNAYDALTDELTGSDVYYDTDGEATVITNVPKV